MINTDGSPFVETLAESSTIKVERVAARGQVSPAAFCEQPVGDFLVLLKGELDLEYKGTKEIVKLRPGDSIFTEPGEDNRVARTSENAETVWVKVSYMGKPRKGIFPAPDARGEDSRVKNIFQDTAVIESLIETEAVRVERVLSSGQSRGVECLQSPCEWLTVLQGNTILEIDGEEHRLGPGDHVYIPPGVKNRVVWTADYDTTIWVAAYWKAEKGTKRALQAKFPASTGY
jgi:cupin 2 domain-containing protein